MRRTCLTVAALTLISCHPTPSNSHAESKHSSHGLHHHNHDKRFKDADEWSKRFDAPSRDQWQKPQHVIELMEIKPGMSVADVGAGTGYFLPYLSKAVGDKGTVVAVDIEPDMIRFMNERIRSEELNNVTAKLVPTDNPSLAKGSLDRILIVNTWHHINTRQYLDKLIASLAPEGSIYIVDYTPKAPHGPPAHARIPAQTVVSQLTSATLMSQEIAEDLPHQYVVIGTKKQNDKLIPNAP